MDWQFINSFAGWFSALGTIAAVVVALYFARQDKRIRLRVNAGHRIVVAPDSEGPHPEYLVMGATNVGHREAQITGLGWRIGFFRKRFFEQAPMWNDGISSPLPSRLRDGDEARYYFPLSGETRWLPDFAQKMLLPRAKWNLRCARVRVFTSVGKVFEAPLEPGLRRRLVKFTSNLPSG